MIKLAIALVALSFAATAQDSEDRLLKEIVGLERSALDKWITLNPQGYLDLYAPEMTYFDPAREKRVDGLEAIKTLLEPMRSMKSPTADPRYDMISPKVQHHGDVALLTFNLINYGKRGGAPEAILAKWNCSEVYTRMGGKWKIIHSHWSITKPETK